jgi:hypothetical protein
MGKLLSALLRMEQSRFGAVTRTEAQRSRKVIETFSTPGKSPLTPPLRLRGGGWGGGVHKAPNRRAESARLY